MMERRFDMTDFEQSLKDHADQFNMTPSKRVWKGIYNNLHPGSKWPSITVAIVFIIALITIGNLNNSLKPEENYRPSETIGNNNNIYESIKLADGNKESAAPIETGNSSVQRKDFNFLPNEHVFPNTLQPYQSLRQQNQSLIPQDLLITENQSTNQIINDESQLASINDQGQPSSININSPKDIKPDVANALPANKKIVAADGYLSMIGGQQKYVQKNSILPANEFISTSGIEGSATPKRIFSFAHFVIKGLSLVDNNTLFANATVLQDQDPNSPLNRNSRKIKRAKWMFYLTPSVSSASFRNKDMAQGIGSNFPISQNRSFNGMTYKAGLGLEAGAQMSYPLFGKWDLITGANIHYSDYNVVSNLVHPTFTTLSFRDNTGSNYSKTYITHYGNGITQNQIDLLNYSLQVSVPVGLQYRIWQNKNVQINMLTTMDVSAIIKSNAYIISSDGRYYVKDPSLSRPVNMGLNFNPNIILSGKKIKWHLGPSIRYQLRSRYNDNYMTKEHLIDYGIRIGISK